MKKFFLFLTLLTLSVGQMWGAIATGTYELCTSTSDLVASGHYIIASSKSDGTAYAIASTSKNDNRATVSVTVASEKITIAANSTVMTFTLGGDNTNGWTFSTDNYANTAGMLAATSSNNNRLGVVASPGANGKWAITFSSGLAKPVAQGTYTRKYMKYNYNQGTPIFNCYSSSGSESVYIYKLSASCDDITPTLSYTSTNLTIGGGNSSSPTLNKDGSSGAVTWSSDDEDVATVNSSGVVTPVGTGTCNITASIAAAGGKCAGEVSVEFTVTRTITYYVGSTSYTVGGIDGETLVSTLPASPTSCDAVNYPHFYGWKNGSISGSTTTAPTILSTETVSSSSAANTYYAVFTDVVPSAGWEKLTSISASNIGDEVVFVYDGLTKYEMTGVASNLGTATERDEIPDDIAGTFTMTIEKGYNNTGYSFKNGTKYIRHNADKKIELSTTKDALSSWTPSGSSGNFKLNNNSNTSYNLQFNSGSPRWTDYSSSLSSFQIYKRASGGTVNYITTCCSPLASINGSVSVTNQTVSWSAVTDASGYKVKVGTGEWSDIGNVTSKTFDLPCGGDTYNVYVMAYNTNNAGHCTGDGPSSDAIQVTSAACTEPAITVDPNALTGLSYIVGAGPSAAKSFNVKGSNLTGALTVKANDNYEICLTNSATAADWKSGATTLSIAQGTAESNAGQNVYVRLKSGKAVGDYNSNTIKVYGGGIEEASAVTVTVSGTVLQPTLSASPNSIAFGEVASTSSASHNVTVTMTNITGNVTASLTGTDAAKFSIDKNSLSSSGTITVSKNSTAVGGPYSATLSLSATGVSTVEIPISMTLIEIPTYTLRALNLIEEGDEVIIVGNNGDTYAMSNNNGTSAPTAVEVTITNNAITNPANTIIWTLSPSNSGYTFYPKGSTTTWLYCTSTNNGVKVGTEANKLFTLDESGYLKNSGTSRYVGIYNSQDWRCYTSTGGNIEDQTFSFYVKESTTPKVNISGTMNAFSYMRDNGPSAAQTFSVSGNKLTADLVVNAPENYEICATENGTYVASLNLTPENKTVSETTLYIRLKSDLAVNSYNGDITVSSTGATNATKAVTGSVTTPVYTVTLNTNGGTIEDGHDVTSYTEGVGATLPTAEYISKSGFSFEGWYANSDLTTGGVQTTIGTNATGNKTYWAKWEELPGYDITWLVDGEAYTGGEPDVHVVYNGSISKLPSTPTSLDITSKTFVGWTTEPVNNKQAIAPTPLYTAANQIPGNITENKIFYAVFAQEVLSGEFTKVTDASTLAAGDRLLIHSNNYAAGTIGDNTFLSRESVTFTDEDITNKGNAVVYVLGGTSGAWTLTSDEEGTLKCYGTSNNNLSMSEGTGTWNITISSGNASITNTEHTSRYIRYNSSGSRFSSYASNTQGTAAPQLYREGTSLNDYTTKFVKPVAVTGVTLNKNATTLAIGGTETLTETVAPANATNKNISWTTSAEGVATVEDGVVTAVAAGEATITVTTEDGSFTDECVVTVLPTVETPTFSPAAGAINKGSKVTISCATEGASILYSLDNGDNWSAYPEGGVAINANCTLQAKATKENYTTSAVASAAYTIIKATQTVSFTESAYAFRLESDEYDAFTGQVASSTYGSAVITYASSNTSVAEVNTNTGVVTLKGVKGTTTITATAAEDADYQSAQATYTITVLRAGKTRTGDFQLVTNASQLADGDYILLTSETRNGYENPDYASVFSGITSSAGTFQNKNVANEEITYAQLLTEGNTAKIIYLEKVTVGNIDYWAFNYGTESDIYIAALTNSSNGLNSEGSTSDYSLWSISIGANNVANVTNKGNSGHGVLSYNTQGSGAFKAYTQLQSGSLRIYKQKDKNKLPQTLSFATPSYEFPLNESAYTSFSYQTVSGAQTAVTYTTSSAEVAAIVNNEVVLQGGVGTATITATAAESEDYERATATYTITVTAALNTVTFHYYKPADATADQTALKEASSGAGITVPAKPANVGEYEFIGWAPATLVETQTAPNNLVALQAGATYYPTTNEDYYAIYRRLENSDGRFYLMHNNNYAKAPVGTDTKSFGNTTNIEEAAVFVQTEDNKLYYDNNGTPRYFSSISTSARDIDFTPNAADAETWTITESGLITTFYSSISGKYFARNGTQYWAAYAISSLTAENQSKDLTKVYLADVYYSSTPDLMVSPVLTWAQGNATHEMEIGATYDNAATATVGGEPVNVTYTSSDPTKATVSDAGVVTAHLGGLVTITATVAENPGVSRQLVETYQVSITKKVPQITFADATEGDYKYKVFVGEAYKKDLSENVTIVSDGAVSYSLSGGATSSTYAEINASTGVVTGKSSTGSAIQYMFVRTAETDTYQAGEANHIFYVLSLKNQALAFGQNAYEFDMNETVADFANTLTGVQTSATFASNNTSVAEVDAESGEVTIHTNVCGTATITATAAEGQVGDEVYKEVSLSYTITVNYPMPTFSMESSDIKAPVSLAISGYDENTKLYWTDGNEDPATEYSEPIAISETKTIRAKATNADDSNVSPIASVTLTKVTPTVTGTQDGGTITLSSDENSLITYIIENGNHVIVASGEDVPAPVVFETEMSDTYNVVAYATWDVEGGFSGSEYEHDFVVKAKGHLPISYTGDGSGLDDEAWASIIGTLGNYGSDPKIQFKNEECALIAAFAEQPVQLSYDIKHQPAYNTAWETTSNVYSVQWSADGETYNDIVVYNSTHPMSKDEITSETFDLDPSARYIKWIYNTKTQSTGGNVALGNIRITCEAVVIDGVSVVDIPEGYDGDVVVEDGVTWKPVNNGHQPEIHNLWVKQGAVVDLNMATLEVNDVILEAQDGYSGQILEPSNFAASGNVYYDLTLNTTGTMDHSKWYSFAVPFKVDAATGIQRLSNDGKTSNAGFNSHYRLLKYNSSLRASSGNGWEYMTAGETLEPGKFYMIAMNSNEYNRVRMTKKAGENINNAGNIAFTITGTGLQDNWNALANNALYYANVGVTGDDNSVVEKVQVYDPIAKSYNALGFGDVTFTVGTPFFIQVVGEGNMTIVAAGSSVHDALHAPTYRTESTEEFQLRLGADTESYYDQLYVSAGDEALNSYQIGHDLAKAGVSTTVPQMYIEAYGGKLCDAEFPLVNREATFPLTFTSPSAGTYQLYLVAAPENADLYLQHNGVVVWDLKLGAYALELTNGTNTEYSLLLQMKSETPTGIEDSVFSDQSSAVQKVIIDEKVYILRGGEMYGVDGKLVK